MSNYDNIVIKELLSELKDRDIKSIYSLHEKYRIGPCDMAKAVNFLIDNKIIELSNNKIKLLNITDEKLLLSLRTYYLNDSPSLLKTDIEQDYECIEINKPYMPNKRYLDTKYFNIEEK